MQSIIGPPGTGKTYALEQRIKQDDKQYIYLTYNRSMAEVARKRIGADEHVIGTFHSILSKHFHLIGGATGDFLLDSELEDWCDSIGISYTTPADEEGYRAEMSDYQRFQQYYDYFENMMIKPFQPEQERLAIPLLYDKYKAFKERLGKLDYTDILLRGSQDELPYIPTLYVDEAQDNTPLMWKIIDRWPSDEKVYALDDEQTLYGYKGVNMKTTLAHVQNPEILKECRRYGPAIKTVAERIISPVRKIERDYKASGNSETGKYSLRNFLDLPGTKSILCRTNYLAREVARTLNAPAKPINREHGLGIGWTPLTFEMHDISMRYPNLQKSEWELIVKHTPANIWKRGTKRNAKLGTLSLEYFSSMQTPEWRNIVSLMNITDKQKHNLTRYAGKPINPVYIDTIHSAKGLEFDHVLLASDKPLDMPFDAEEHRVLYVGVTRARQSLDFHSFNVYADNYEMWRYFS